MNKLKWWFGKKPKYEYDDFVTDNTNDYGIAKYYYEQCKYLEDKCWKQQQKIYKLQQLVKVIDELEKWLKERINRYEYSAGNMNMAAAGTLEAILNKLTELKGGENND